MARSFSALVLFPAAVAGFLQHRSFLHVPRKLESPCRSAKEDNEIDVSIEFCTGCRWMLRSAWMAQELLSAFSQESLNSVTLIPVRSPAPGGIYRVRQNGELVWDRKQEGGFPEAATLKARLGPILAPEEMEASSEAQEEVITDCEDCPPSPDPLLLWDMPDNLMGGTLSPVPNVAITYSMANQWMMQSAWFAQELFTTFDTELNSITLIPSMINDDVFQVELNGELLWDRTSEGRFPEAKELKRLIRNTLVPAKDLGHSDVKTSSSTTTTTATTETEAPFQDMNEDEAADMRQYFGVM